MLDHDLDSQLEPHHVGYQRRPILDEAGAEVEGLHAVWITLNNPEQLNSYTTAMVKEVILAFRRASNDRAAVAVVFTGAGERAFCTGGNTAEYSEHYAGRPEEYRQYMRLFNDMVTAILTCDRPVINRVNGLRIAGGQEIGMACDFSLASDLARFGQAGPRHGSAPDGGSTDFLDLYVGWGQAAWSCVTCETWTAHEALRLGLVNDIFPVLVIDGRFVANPLVVTDRMLDEHGRIVHGRMRDGEAMTRGKARLAEGRIDFELLDRGVQALITRIAMTMPGCTTKTVESLRRKKLLHWDRNRELNRAWLALNMMTEGRAGFRAFHHGSKTTGREVDFLELRRRLAAGDAWDEDLLRKVAPHAPWSMPAGAAHRDRG